MDKKAKRVGIMGGTFDPIHLGHLILGETAFEQFDLDKVLFMPSGNPPHKKNRLGRATDEQRVEMVRRAIASNPHFEISLIDMNEEGYSYTYRTLENLNREYLDTEFYFIMGADSLFEFENWKEPQRICDAAIIVVATRNHTNELHLDQTIHELAQKFNADFLKLDSMNIDISSAMLRSWIQNGRTTRYYLTDSVRQYIDEQNIYGGQK